MLPIGVPYCKLMFHVTIASIAKFTTPQGWHEGREYFPRTENYEASPLASHITIH